MPRKTWEAAREKQQRKEKVTVEGKGRKEKKERSKKASDDDGGKRKFYFEIQDVYMHSCKAPKNAPWTEEVGIDLRDSSGEVEGGGEHNGGGTYIEKSGGEGTYVAKLIKETFGVWMNEVKRRYPDPFKVDPKEWERMKWKRTDIDGVLPLSDARFQIEMREEMDIPHLIDKKKMDQVVTWKLMMMVNKLGGAQCFTKHYPVNLYGNQQRGQMRGPGSYPSEQEGHPVHLYADSVILVLGGCQATVDGKKAANTVRSHQTLHRDFVCSPYPDGTKTCPLLYGLKDPFLFNVALGECRKVWVHNGKLGMPELKVIPQYGTLALHCDAIHGEECYKWNQEYYPLLQVVVESTRYPKKPGGVKVEVGTNPSMEGYQLYHVDREGLSTMVNTEQDRVEALVLHQERTGFALPKEHIAFLAKYKEIFMGGNADVFKPGEFVNMDEESENIGERVEATEREQLVIE